MTQNLNHYEKILSRSHSNYLAQISIEMTEANNQINDVLSKLTALGTVLIPMNLVTGEYYPFLFFFFHVRILLTLFLLYYFRFMGNERTCSRPRLYWGKVNHMESTLILLMVFSCRTTRLGLHVVHLHYMRSRSFRFSWRLFDL